MGISKTIIVRNVRNCERKGNFKVVQRDNYHN